MEHSSQAGGSVNSGSAGGWGTMGGRPGDGFAGQASPPSTPYAAPSPPPQAQPQQYTATPPSGSITRFATPDLQQPQGSYAARSAQAYAGYQQQQQSAYNFSPPMHAYAAPSPPAYPTPPPQPQPTGSYAARSQQAHQQQQQQPPVQGYHPQPYAQQQQQPVASSYAERSAQAYQSPSGYQQPQPTSYQPMPPPQQQSSTPSYAARSQPAYQQPPPSSSQGSYAARSQAAYQQQYTPPAAQQQQYSSPSPYGPSQSYGPSAQGQQPQQQGYGQAPTPPSAGQPGYQPQPQQQPPYQAPPHSGHQPVAHAVGPPYQPAAPAPPPLLPGQETPQAQAMQQRLLTDATRKVQEHAYYMKQAMEQKNLPVVLDRAAHMVGELGGPPHGAQHHTSSTSSSGPSNTGVSAKMNPKIYYELYMRALEEMPTFEDYLLNLVKQPVPTDQIQIVDAAHGSTLRRDPYTMRELYDCTQFCPRVVSRLYLQISAGSALIRSGEVSAKWVINDLAQAVRCEQNPIRGLFMRNFLLTALRDKLPDTPAPPPGAPSLQTIQSEETLESDKRESQSVAGEHDAGTVKDSYEFVLNNFMEMNKLWVRLQHLPGEGKSKDVRKRRERERNDLRILVGTNLVRLSQLECVTSKIYGEVILPQILEHIVVSGDPLSQAYLMDCLVQVFPDEYHIETLPILLNVCPRLRDKVNIRTILQGLMDRLANYLAEEELLDESDTNQVKKALARDSFGLFEECVQKVYNARGPKLTSREVIRLQTALLQFSIKCYPGNMSQISQCLGVCVSALRQANASYEAPEGTVANVPEDKIVIKPLDEISVAELEKLLSIPLDSLALRVLKLAHYSELLAFLPWANRREVAINMLKAVDAAGSTPSSIAEFEQLFSVIKPIVVDEGTTHTPAANDYTAARATSLMAGLGVSHSPHISFGASFNENDSERLKAVEKENILVSKLVHLLDHENVDTLFEMLTVARSHISQGGRNRAGQTLVAVVFAAVKLAKRLSQPSSTPAQGSTTEPAVSKPTVDEPESDMIDTGDGAPMGETEETAPTTESDEGPTGETMEASAEPESAPTEEAEPAEISNSTNCRKVFVFIQETVAMVSKASAETGVKLYLEMSLTADSFSKDVDDESSAKADFVSIAYEMLSQSYSLYEETITESKAQQRCIRLMIGALLASNSLSKDDYERLITKTAQFSAKVVKKPDQCQLVALCAHLFYPVDSPNFSQYSNAQRALECLQRSLKLADACTSANPANVQLFVDLLEHYVFFFEKKNPVIGANYISGLAALIKEHTSNADSFDGDSRAVADARAQFIEVLRYIRRKKADEATAEVFAPIQVENLGV